jgi:hypothetical protein
MTTSFRAWYKVVKRNIGSWVNGVYVLDDDLGNQVTIAATIQNPNSGDREVIQATPYGRRVDRSIKIYTDVRLQPVSQATLAGEMAQPGDIIIYENRHYLIFHEADKQALAKTRQSRVSHYKYYACETIEGADMEGAP